MLVLDFLHRVRGGGGGGGGGGLIWMQVLTILSTFLGGKRPGGEERARPDFRRGNHPDLTPLSREAGRNRPARPAARDRARWGSRNIARTVMILPQVHLRKPCYDFYTRPVWALSRPTVLARSCGLRGSLLELSSLDGTCIPNIPSLTPHPSSLDVQFETHDKRSKETFSLTALSHITFYHIIGHALYYNVKYCPSLAPHSRTPSSLLVVPLVGPSSPLSFMVDLKMPP